TVQSNTFGKTYEDQGFTKDAGVFADSSKCSGSSAGNCDTAADTGKSGYQCGGQISHACADGDSVSGVSQYVYFAHQHNGGGNDHSSEEKERVYADGFLISAFVSFAHQVYAE